VAGGGYDREMAGGAQGGRQRGKVQPCGASFNPHDLGQGGDVKE